MLTTPRPQNASKMLRLPDVIQSTGLSSSSIYAMMSRGEFPRPIRLGKRAVGWPEERLVEWLATRPGGEDDAGEPFPGQTLDTQSSKKLAVPNVRRVKQ